ncbi:type II toxin-antitoxin system RelE/ParE family toxin [Bacteroides sp.]
MDIIQIRWDKKALEQVKAAVTYCKDVYGKKTALSFRQQIIDDSNLLINHPFLGKREELLSDLEIEYRSLLIGHLHKLVYTVNTHEKTIYIHLFWNCYQEPENMQKNIKK